MNDIFEMLGSMFDPTVCVNCHKPLDENDEGQSTEIPNAKICKRCVDAKNNLLNKFQEGVTIKYRDGSEIIVGGNGWNTNQ